MNRTTPACNAPFASMHLDPRGNVRACELNSMQMLGNVGTKRLLDIWRDRPVRRLRDALARHDLSLGCEGCAWQIRAGDGALAHAHEYDRFTIADGPDRWPRQLELSLSNTCNLQCQQCSGELSSAIRARREHLPPLPPAYDDAFFADLGQFLPHLERLVMIGGEPFLARESLRVFDQLIDAGLTPRCQVSTNGTVWNDHVERILDRLPVDVSVSIDGASTGTYDAIRVGAHLPDTLRNLDRFIERGERHGTTVNLNHCLMAANAHELADLLLLAEGRGIGVHVLTVTHPAHLSVFRLGSADLAQLIADLDAEAERKLGGLERNRYVWEEQLARLRHHLATIEAASVEVRRRSSGPADAAVSARTVVEELAQGQAVHHIDILDSEIVTAVGPDATAVLGLDLSDLVGNHISAIMPKLTGAFGEVERTDLRHLGDGVEHRTIVLVRDGARTTVSSVLETGTDDRASRWYLTAGTERLAPT
jgi:MoaA/NifB/PqqE/SkfB family radical SAM enzyme